MAVAVGQIQVHVKEPVDGNILGIGRSTVPVTVAGDLAEGDLGILHMDESSVVVIVAQVDDGIRLDRIDAPVHKGSSAVGIRKDQNSLHKLAPHFIIV
jgi:hypothetical protein